MKKTALFLASLSMILLAILPIFIGLNLQNSCAQDVETTITTEENKSNHSYVIVNGYACIQAKPDSAVIHIGVESKNEILNDAIEDNTLKVNSIISYLSENGINEDEIQTQNYSINQWVDYSNLTKTLDYNVYTAITYKTYNLTNISDVIGELTKLGVNKVSGIDFECSDISKYYNEALVKALENADAKAKSLCGDNVTVKTIIEETTNFNSPCWKIEAYSLDNNIMSGNLKICAKLKVKYAF